MEISVKPTKYRFIPRSLRLVVLLPIALRIKGYVRDGLGGWATCQIHLGTKAACAVPEISICWSLYLLYSLDIDFLVYLLPGLEEIDRFLSSS